MERRIVGYSQDEAGEPVAILDCGHPQHIRHDPPFISRPWTQSAEGREGMVGSVLNCRRCDDEIGWWAIPLGDALTAEALLSDIAAEFESAADGAGRPLDMAVFKRHDQESSTQCEVTAYFSPRAGELAQRFGAKPCGQPLQRNLDLLAGDERSWRVLFGH